MQKKRLITILCIRSPLGFLTEANHQQAVRNTDEPCMYYINVVYTYSDINGILSIPPIIFKSSNNQYLATYLRQSF